MCSSCFIPLFQNHYPLILLSPLFQPLDQNQPNGEQTVSMTNQVIQEYTLKNTPFHISIFRKSLSLSKNFLEFSHKAIYPTMGGKTLKSMVFMNSPVGESLPGCLSSTPVRRKLLIPQAVFFRKSISP